MTGNSAAGPDCGDLTKAVAALCRLSTQQFVVRDLLRRLVDVAADHLDVDGAGTMVADGEDLLFVHASSTAVDRLEQLQALMQQGPCRDAVGLLGEVAVPDLGVLDQTSQWALYLAGARQVGLRSVVAVPLVSRGRAWGVLDLYRAAPGPWSRQELAAARLLADVAVSYVVMAADRDEARAAQSELAHRSTHDELTGLPNRALLFDRLAHALTAAARHGQTVAVFFLDLDGFKQINDTLGHAAGDSVLVQAAERLAATLRADDTLARLSGDEFVVVCEQLPQAADAELDAQVTAVDSRIRQALVAPIRVGEVDLVLSASIGVALSDRQSTADELLSEADAAMYRAKQRRHAQLVVRDTARTVATRPLRHLERDLAQALPNGQLRVHYQPIVAADDLTVRSVEALLRWQHPVHGLLPAAEFIDVAETTGLITSIGEWLIDAVCAQLRDWHNGLGRRSPGTVYVNLSARELTAPTLPQMLHAALSRHRLQPRHLGLELLETSFIHPHLVPALQTLHWLGHPLSIDDFGTGYSSLSRLVQLPVDTAKIDRSFVEALEHDPRSRALVEAVLVVADKLDLQVVGEGVENDAQARALREAGCHLLQGFHLGAPQAPTELTAAWAS